MPIYEYECKDCHNQFEMIRPMNEADSKTICVNCQSENVKRRISLFNATSEGRTMSSSSGCSDCAGGACNTCGFN